MKTGSMYGATRAWGPCVEGPALVVPLAFSPRYDLDRTRGIFARIGHPCYGLSIAGFILVCPGVQGGVAGGWAFLEMKARSVGFAGLVFGGVNPVMVQGAIAAEIPVLAGIDARIFDEISSGTPLLIDPSDRSVLVLG
jgi:predicted aconitase with swiveling domain